MAPQSSALQHCFDEVADSAPMALERCLSHVVTVLQAAETKTVQAAERTEIGDAWRELLQHQAAWCKRYPDELRAAFGASGGKPSADAAATHRSTGGPKLELTLVDDSAIDGAIESSRLVRHVMPLVERPVSELDALVSSAMGLLTVQPELNPVRPEVFAQSLRALIDGSQVKASTGSLWMKYMAEPLGHELQQLYGRLVIQLKHANVQAAGYRVTQTPGGATPARAAPAKDQPSAAATGNDPGEAGFPSGFASLSSRQISHALMRDFLSNGAGAQASHSQVLPPSYYAQVDREIARLKDDSQGQRDVAPQAPLPEGYRELPPVDRPQRAVGVQSTLDSQVWGGYADSHERSMVRAQLRKDATRVAQVLGLELVRKVVNQIAQDPRLLAPVREAIVALEPSLLRLAMVDPRFFTEEHHPGRRLMDCAAQRSFKYNDEFSTDFAGFFEDLGRSFNDLNQADIDSAQPFEAALAGLEAIWQEQDRAEADPSTRALQAMRFAEQRQAEADRIAYDLSSRPDLEAVPTTVQDFLFGPWALVLAHARLTDSANRIDPQGYLSVISDLLWSVKPEVTLRQPALLFERLPPLLGKLREGLALLGQEPEANEPFFQDLMQLHRPVLKLRRAKSRRDALESGLTPLAAADVARVPASEVEDNGEAIEGQPWMSPHELDALGFQETMPTDMAQLWAEEEQASQSAPLTPAVAEAAADAQPAGEIDAEAVLANLREGDWIDLYSKRHWLRAQLIWASTKSTLFMFVSHGGRPHSMTRRICERLIRERYLRPVRMDGVVAGALDAVGREDAVPAHS